MEIEEPIRILHLEDDPNDAELIRLALNTLKRPVTYIHVDGSATLRRALADPSTPPDLVLCDFNLPGLSGYEALDIVRQHDATLPVVFVSGVLDEQFAVESMTKGVSDIVLKERLGRLPAAVLRGLEDGTRNRAIREAQAHMRMHSAIIAAAANGVVVTNVSGRILWCNEAFLGLSGYTAAELVGQNPNILKSGLHDDAFYAELWETIQSGSAWSGEIINKRKNGELIYVQQTITPVLNARGEIEFFAGIGRDVSQLKTLEDRLAQVALFDAATGLPNRSHFVNQLEVAIAHAKRRPSYHFGLMLLDVRRFNQITTSLGSVIGDQLLKEVGQRVSGVLRSGDVVGRLGADVFGVLLDDLGEPDDLMRVKEAVVSAVCDEPVEILERVVHVELSVGIALGTVDAGSGQLLLEAADAALHRAKKGSGKHPWAFSDPTLDNRARQALIIEQKIRDAIREERILTLFQPLIDLKTDRLQGFECLVRIIDTDGSMISPLDFIPVAEETRLIAGITDAVIRDACHAQEAFGNGIVLNVNISGTQMADPAMVENLLRRIRACGGNPQRLMLEITESTLIRVFESHNQIINDLVDAGFRLAIDDFGTGYSSLSYLQNLPIDCVKIDRTFIREFPEKRAGSEIAKAIVQMAHALRISVTAEGAETIEQVEFLKATSCDSVQGFYYSKPIPMDEALAKWKFPRSPPQILNTHNSGARRLK